MWYFKRLDSSAPQFPFSHINWTIQISVEEEHYLPECKDEKLSKTSSAVVHAACRLSILIKKNWFPKHFFFQLTINTNFIKKPNNSRLQLFYAHDLITSLSLLLSFGKKCAKNKKKFFVFQMRWQIRIK